MVFELRYSDFLSKIGNKEIQKKELAIITLPDEPFFGGSIW